MILCEAQRASLRIKTQLQLIIRNPFLDDLLNAYVFFIVKALPIKKAAILATRMAAFRCPYLIPSTHRAKLRQNLDRLADLDLTAGNNRVDRSEEHTSELQSRPHLVCRLLLEKKNKHN